MKFIRDWIRKVVAPDINSATARLDNRASETHQDLCNSLTELAGRTDALEKAPEAVKADFLALRGAQLSDLSKFLNESQARLGAAELALDRKVMEVEGIVSKLRKKAEEIAATSDRREREVGKAIHGTVESRVKAVEMAQDFALQKAQEVLAESKAVNELAKQGLDLARRAANDALTFSAKLNLLDSQLKEAKKEFKWTAFSEQEVRAGLEPVGPAKQNIRR